jgi:hypothetical protein
MDRTNFMVQIFLGPKGSPSGSIGFFGFLLPGPGCQTHKSLIIAQIFGQKIVYQVAKMALKSQKNGPDIPRAVESEQRFSYLAK